METRLLRHAAFTRFWVGDIASTLANQMLEDEDYAWATEAIVEVARSRSRGRVVSSLEGGYDLQALGRSAVAHVRALQGA